MVKQISNPEEFKKIIAEDEFVVVDFFTTWCGPCRMIAPFFKELSEKENLKGATFLKVEADSREMQSIAEEYQVSSFPTFLFFFRGSVVGDIIGADKNKLEKTIKESLETINSLKNSNANE